MNNIQDFYNINQFPGDYDVTYCVSAATNGFNPYINFILDNIKKDDKIIDVGCGTGYITNTIATLKQNDITGLDFSNAIKIAKGKSILLENNVKWLKKDFFDLDENIKYDVIICQGVFHHMPNYIHAIKKFEKILNEDGVLLLGVYNRWVKKLQKIIPLSFHNSSILKTDQMLCPFEVGFSRKQVKNLFSNFKINNSYPNTYEYFPNVHLTAKINSGGLTIFRLEKR